MQEQLLELANAYRQAGETLHDAVRARIEAAGGFVNAANNRDNKPDMTALVFNSTKGHPESFPIRALRVSPSGTVEAYIGTPGAIYTDKYLRGKNSEEHWLPLKDSNILFSQTILSIASTIDEYLE